MSFTVKHGPRACLAHNSAIIMSCLSFNVVQLSVCIVYAVQTWNAHWNICSRPYKQTTRYRCVPFTSHRESCHRKVRPCSVDSFNGRVTRADFRAGWIILPRGQKSQGSRSKVTWFKMVGQRSRSPCQKTWFSRTLHSQFEMLPKDGSRTKVTLSKIRYNKKNDWKCHVTMVAQSLPA